jgi:hypothetical protein
MHQTSLAAVAVGPLLLVFLISTFLPWVTALVTAKEAHPGLKAVFLLAISTATGFLTEYAGNPVYDWKLGALGAVEAFVVAVLAHFGLWVPTGVTGANGGIARAVPSGIGKRYAKAA